MLINEGVKATDGTTPTVTSQITYWTTHDLYTHDSITQCVIDLDQALLGCATPKSGITMIAIYMIATPTFTCNYKVMYQGTSCELIGLYQVQW